MAGKKYCPNCGSENVMEEEGKYICNACDFEASVFPERHLIVEDIDDEMEEEEELIKKVKTKTKKAIKSKKKRTKGKK